MSAVTLAGYVIVTIGTVFGLLAVVACGVVVLRSGVAKGLREASEGWEARANQLNEDLAECKAEVISVTTEHTHELATVREELAAARERISLLEQRTDLEPIREWMHVHSGDALTRHEGIVSALTAIEMKIREKR